MKLVILWANPILYNHTGRKRSMYDITLENEFLTFHQRIIFTYSNSSMGSANCDWEHAKEKST